MRQTTKIKNVLLMYDIAFTSDDEGLLTLTMTSKIDNSVVRFKGVYGTVIYKAYSYMNKTLKQIEKPFIPPTGKRLRFNGENEGAPFKKTKNWAFNGYSLRD